MRQNRMAVESAKSAQGKEVITSSLIWRAEDGHQHRPECFDSRTAEELILQNLTLVRQVAHQLRRKLPRHIELDELISAGTMGLLDAAHKFNSEKDVEFVSYARFRIRGAILDSLRTLDWSPRDLRRKCREIRQVQSRLSISLQRTPSESEVADAMHLSLIDYQQLIGRLESLQIGSLQEDHGDDVSGITLDKVAAPEEENPLLQCLQAEMREQLAEAIDTLPEKERLVVTLRYYEELSVREIALVLGVVESRVSQLHRSAVERLCSFFANNKARRVDC